MPHAASQEDAGQRVPCGADDLLGPSTRAKTEWWAGDYYKNWISSTLERLVTKEGVDGSAYDAGSDMLEYEMSLNGYAR